MTIKTHTLCVIYHHRWLELLHITLREACCYFCHRLLIISCGWRHIMQQFHHTCLDKWSDVTPKLEHELWIFPRGKMCKWYWKHQRLSITETPRRFAVVMPASRQEATHVSQHLSGLKEEEAVCLPVVRWEQLILNKKKLNVDVMALEEEAQGQIIPSLANPGLSAPSLFTYHQFPPVLSLHDSHQGTIGSVSG